jgi:hypothetical protein
MVLAAGLIAPAECSAAVAAPGARQASGHRCRRWLHSARYCGRIAHDLLSGFQVLTCHAADSVSLVLRLSRASDFSGFLSDSVLPSGVSVANPEELAVNLHPAGWS